MTRIKALITRMGGPIPLSQALSLNVETVRSWGAADLVPSKWVAQVYGLAKAKGVRLTLGDLFDLGVDSASPEGSTEPWRPMRWPPEVIVTNPWNVPCSVKADSSTPGRIVVAISPPISQPVIADAAK